MDLYRRKSGFRKKKKRSWNKGGVRREKNKERIRISGLERTLITRTDLVSLYYCSAYFPFYY